MEFPHPCSPMQSGGNPGFPLAFEVHAVGRGNLRILSINLECPVRPAGPLGANFRRGELPEPRGNPSA